MTDNLFHFLTFLAVQKPVEPEAPSAFGTEMIIFMIIIFLAFIFLIDRPQKKKMAQEAEKKKEGFKKGQQVVSSGGIHGSVAKVDKKKNTVFVTVAKGVDMEFSLTALQLNEPEPEKEADKKS